MASHRSKYDSRSLREVLEGVFGDRSLEDATACRVLVPAVDLIHGKTVVFKTPHQPKFIRDRYFKVVDVALAAAAAPAFFPQAVIDEGSSYADGGLWANNPAILAYAEAIKIQGLQQRQGIDTAFSPSDIHVLSIGTGEPEYYAKPGPAEDGLLWWASRLFEVAIGAESQGVHYLARYIVGDRRYRRVDFKMPSEPWHLDEVGALPDLIHYGEQKAIEEYPIIKDRLLAVKKPAYHPFPP